MDLILGRFAEKYVVNFSASELAQYEQLLQYEDPDLYNWLIGVVTPPANIPLQIIDQIKETINY